MLENKKMFRDKVEDSFASNNSRQLWSNLQIMTGYRPNKKPLVAEDHRKLANDLKSFYARFDSTDFSSERADTLVEVSRGEHREEILTEGEVSRCFKQVNQRSACGPDEIPGAVLKHCHDSLAPVFTRLFQRSLDSGHIPLIWKSSHVIPVRALLRKARAVSADPSHPLHAEFELLPSGRRYRTTRCSKVKFRNSFVPSAIRTLNSSSAARSRRL